MRGGCPAPRPERRVPVVKRAGAHGTCAQGPMPVVWQRILRSTKGQAPVPGGQVRMGRAFGPGARCGRRCSRGRPRRSRVIMGRALRPDARYAATNSLVDRSMPVAGVRQGAHPACARRGSARCVAAAPGLRPVRRVPVAERAGDHGACAQAGYRYAATDPPVHGEEWPGDHGACGRGGTPGAVGAHEGVSGSCRVIMGRALRAACPSRGNGFSHRSEGGLGRARPRGRSGGEGGCHGVRGDHGACAQGRMPVTRQRIPRIDGRRAPAEHGRCSWGVRLVRDAPDHQMRPGRSYRRYEVIMGRALRAGCPLRGNGSLESTGGVRRRRTVMGCAVGRNRLVRPGPHEGLGIVPVIMGRALRAA